MAEIVINALVCACYMQWSVHIAHRYCPKTWNIVHNDNDLKSEMLFLFTQNLRIFHLNVDLMFFHKIIVEDPSQTRTQTTNFHELFTSAMTYECIISTRFKCECSWSALYCKHQTNNSLTHFAFFSFGACQQKIRNINM